MTISKLDGSFLLADASGVAKTVYGLHADGFFAGDFVDLATIIEHSILGTVALVPGGKAVPEAMLAPIRHWIEAGAIRLLAERSPLIWEPPPSATDRRPAPEGFFNTKRSKPIDAQLEAARVASAELEHGRPGMLLARQRNAYSELARPGAEHFMCDLLLLHRRLIDAIYAFKRRAEAPGLVLARVPPFAHIVLSKASNFSDIVEITLQFRHRCRGLREAEDQLYQIMSSRDIGSLEKAKARDRFLGGWEEMIEACGETSTVEMVFANSSAQVLRHAKETAFALWRRDGEEVVDHGRDFIEKLLENFSADEWEQKRPWTLRPVRTASWQLLTAPDRAMHDAAHRIFKTPRTTVEARLKVLSQVLRET